jgi:hypothetical protein
MTDPDPIVPDATDTIEPPPEEVTDAPEACDFSTAGAKRE